MSNEIPALALLESLVLLTAIGKNDREREKNFEVQTIAICFWALEAKNKVKNVG